MLPQQFHTLLEHGEDLVRIRLYQATALDKGECQDLLFDEMRIQGHPNFLPVLFCRGRMKNHVGTFTSRSTEYFNMLKSLVRARVMYGWVPFTALKYGARHDRAVASTSPSSASRCGAWLTREPPETSAGPTAHRGMPSTSRNTGHV